ncbi:MAG TPA: cysteine hydrolase [Acidimicrobiales bacterium]|jgi:ureidoacrylate peracid hydrolase|nr:cysteine hydrolase [Acidimicrobiales bacterium]
MTAAALLVIDMQNGFLHPEGSVTRNDQPMFEVERVVAETVELVAEARTAGLPVVYTQHVFRPDYVDVPPRLRSRDMFTEGHETLVSGSWDAAVADELKPLDSEVVVEKNRYDAFLYTDLDLVLRTLGVGRLLVCGVATNVCVESTVRSAEQRDFEVTVASDCTSGPAEYHHAALASMAYIAAEVVPWRAGLFALA